MIIKFKLQFNDYLKLMYKLYYRRIGFIISLCCLSLLLALIIFNYSQFHYLSDTDITFIVIILSIFVLIPILLYFSSKKNFKSHRFLNENIEYIFFEHKMKAVGESFNSEIDLNNVYKIVELKNWFLIYHSRQTANFLPKKAMDQDQIKEIRNIFNSLTNVKTKLLTS